MSVSRVIAEWEKKSVVVVGWPCRADTWRQFGLPAQQQILALVHKILQNSDEHILIVVNRLDRNAIGTLQIARQGIISYNHRVSVLPVPMDDCWLRDTSPIWVHDTAQDCVKGVCFKFNAWGGTDGGCYQSFQHDALLAPHLCDYFQLEAESVDFILESGAISVNGKGTAITTAQCLLNPNRNQTFTKDRIEQLLATYLGIRNLIWLPYGLLDDTDTDGHVDNMAVFIDEFHVLVSWATQGGNVLRCKAAVNALQDAQTVQGERLILHRVHLPPQIVRSEEQTVFIESDAAKARPAGQTLCASYVNILQTNNAVFIPAFGFQEHDEHAARQVEEALSNTTSKHKKIVLVNADEFVLAGGAIHCLTCNVPFR